MEDTQSPLSSQGTPGLITLVAGKRPGRFAVRIAGPFGFRYVGELHGDTLNKHVKQKHIFHAINGPGFSAALIHSPDIQFSRIVANVEGIGKLETTRDFFKAHAAPIHIRRFEPQLVLPMNQWGMDKVKEWTEERAREKRRQQQRAMQTELFALA